MTRNSGRHNIPKFVLPPKDEPRVHHIVVVLSFVIRCRMERVRWEFEVGSYQEFADEFLKRFGNIHSGDSDVKRILRSQTIHPSLRARIESINKYTDYYVTLVVDGGRIIIN